MSFAGTDLDVRLKSVLMATDLSPASVKPLQHSLAIARHYDAKLYVAHVVSPAGYLIAGPEALELGCEGASQDMEQLQRELLHDGSLGSLDHEFTVRRGHIWQELRTIIFEKHIDLVVVGTHGRRGIEKLVLGSVADRILREADCPVLTVGPHSYREGRIELSGKSQTYLFATDFGEASLRALPHAVSLASKTKAKLILLHVVPVAPIPRIFGWYTPSEVISMRENARMACVRQLEQLMLPDEQSPIESEFVVQFGIPSEQILRVALNRGADLIILGLYRSSLVKTISHMPSATAYEVVCGAGCPVLTVRQ